MINPTNTSHNVIMINFPAHLDDQTVQTWFDQVMEEVQIILKATVPYRVNVVRKANGVGFGYAYVYVGNIKAIYLLHGLETDGSRPVKTSIIDSDVWTGNWADDTIVVYEHGEPPFKPKPIDGDLKAVFKGQAVFSTLASNLEHNVICCRGWDPSIPIDDIKNEVQRYVTIKSRYPKYNYNNKNGIIFITFHPNTNDAQNALLMMKKFVVGGKMLFCSHAFKRIV